MSMNAPLTLSFTQIRAADIPLVGGKGANLGELTGGASEIGWGTAEDVIIQMGPWHQSSEDIPARVDRSLPKWRTDFSEATRQQNAGR